MGGDRNSKPDQSKPAAVSILDEVREMGMGGPDQPRAEADSFCVTPREIPFRAFDGSLVPLGAAAHLIAAEPPQVAVGSRKIGEVTEPLARAMLACLNLGYQMAGQVQTFDPATRIGSLQVAGQRRQAG